MCLFSVQSCKKTREVVAQFVFNLRRFNFFKNNFFFFLSNRCCCIDWVYKVKCPNKILFCNNVEREEMPHFHFSLSSFVQWWNKSISVLFVCNTWRAELSVFNCLHYISTWSMVKLQHVQHKWSNDQIFHKIYNKCRIPWKHHRHTMWNCGLFYILSFISYHFSTPSPFDETKSYFIIQRIAEQTLWTHTDQIFKGYTGGIIEKKCRHKTCWRLLNSTVENSLMQ